MDVILGHHPIMTAYGFWLPNDPRGSWSDFVGAWELFLTGGPATKTDARRSVANRVHDWDERQRVKKFLKREPVEWTGEQALAMRVGFREVAQHWGLQFFACSMLPTHVHLVIGRTAHDIEGMMNQLKGRASRVLVERGLHPFQNVFSKKGERATCWARRGWNVFLDSPADMKRAIAYVEKNRVKEGRKAQRWSFVREYGGERGIVHDRTSRGPEGRG